MLGVHGSKQDLTGKSPRKRAAVREFQGSARGTSSIQLRPSQQVCVTKLPEPGEKNHQKD